MSWTRPPIDPEQRERDKAARRESLVGNAAPRLHVGRYGGTVRPVAPQPKLTREQKVRQDIRDSARGEECAVRLVGVCNFDPLTTVWSHYPENDAGKAMGTKGLDLAGCYSCSACHDVVDGRAPRPAGMTREQVLLDWFRGMVRSLVRLAEKGLL